MRSPLWTPIFLQGRRRYPVNRALTGPTVFSAGKPMAKTLDSVADMDGRTDLHPRHTMTGGCEVGRSTSTSRMVRGLMYPGKSHDEHIADRYI